jgi:hypothetical protein
MAGKRRIPGQPPKPLKRHVTAALAANPDPDVAASVVDYLVAAGDRLNKTRKANT